MDTKDIIKKIIDDLTPTEYPELYSRGDVEDAIRKALDMQTGKIKKQEQPEVDLEKEIDNVIADYSFVKTIDSGGFKTTVLDYAKIARHFHELGQKDAANKYDEVEYNRQRAEEEMLGKTLDEASVNYTDSSDWLTGENLEHLDAAFKAGAKWMAGQGVSWEDQMTYYDGFLLYGKDERAFTMEGNFNEGDKVIVQIRKKED